MEQIARVYADALFEAAEAKGNLDDVHSELDQFTDELDQSNDMRVFFFSPYFSSAEKREAISQAISRHSALGACRSPAAIFPARSFQPRPPPRLARRSPSRA